jgi:hypothetical protein
LVTLTDDKYTLCDEYYRLYDEFRSVEALMHGAENIIREESQQVTLISPLFLPMRISLTTYRNTVSIWFYR